MPEIAHYNPSYVTDISIHTKKHLLEPYKETLKKLYSIFTEGSLKGDLEFTLDKHLLTEIIFLLEKVIYREI